MRFTLSSAPKNFPKRSSLACYFLDYRLRQICMDWLNGIALLANLGALRLGRAHRPCSRRAACIDCAFLQR